MTIQPIDILLTHIQLQGIIHQIEENIALDYAWLNFQRNTAQISKQDYYEILWEITSEVAMTEEGWERYLDFAQLVTSLINEYYVECWFEVDSFLDVFDQL